MENQLLDEESHLENKPQNRIISERKFTHGMGFSLFLHFRKLKIPLTQWEAYDCNFCNLIIFILRSFLSKPSGSSSSSNHPLIFTTLLPLLNPSCFFFRKFIRLPPRQKICDCYVDNLENTQTTTKLSATHIPRWQIFQINLNKMEKNEVGQ